LRFDDDTMLFYNEYQVQLALLVYPIGRYMVDELTFKRCIHGQSSKTIKLMFWKEDGCQWQLTSSFFLIGAEIAAIYNYMLILMVPPHMNW
jgi:hypothetical protein